MNTRFHLLVAGMLLATIATGFGQQPIITTQPQSCTNAVGTTATFTALATGTEPLAYQWQKLSGNWSDLAGCTATNLCLTNVQTSDAGDYRVIVTNVDSAITSDVARLTILIMPRIIPTTNLQHQAVHIGTYAYFRSSPDGKPPLHHRTVLGLRAAQKG